MSASGPWRTSAMVRSMSALGAKQTSAFAASKSANDPERTWATFLSGRFITNVATRTGSAQVRRRDLLKLTGGMAVAWPISTHAQQLSAVRHIGVLLGLSKGTDDPGTG